MVVVTVGFDGLGCHGRSGRTKLVAMGKPPEPETGEPEPGEPETSEPETGESRDPEPRWATITDPPPPILGGDD